MAQQLSQDNSPRPSLHLINSESPRFLITTPGKQTIPPYRNLSPRLLTSKASEQEANEELYISGDRVLPVDGIEDSLDEFSAKQTARRLLHQRRVPPGDNSSSQSPTGKSESQLPQKDSIHFRLEAFRTDQSAEGAVAVEPTLFLGAPKPKSKNPSPSKERPTNKPGLNSSDKIGITDPLNITQDNIQDTALLASNTVDLPPKEKVYLYFAYGGNYPERIKDALSRRANWVEHKEEATCIEKCHFVWRPVNYGIDGYKRIDKRVVRNSGMPLLYNHFEVIKGLTTKTGLIKSMKHYYCQNDQARQAGYQVFDSTPTTFLVPQSLDDSEAQEFIQRYKDLAKGYCPKERTPMKHCANNIWLVKPAAANQGRGIEIFNELSDIIKFISTRQKYSCWVVQKYVERPLLFKERKFDIRVWVLVNQRQEIYLYNQGYLRTSSDDYELNNDNNYVHLTNNCLQQHGTNYGKHEDGNTVSYDVLQDYLNQMFPELQLSVRDHFVPRMKDLIIDSILSVKTQLNPNKRKNVFEIFGYDFLIDEDFRVWLIEVNTNPYLGIPNTFIENLLPKMMDDMFQLVIDPVYPPKTIPENNRTINGYELIYSDCNISAKANGFLGYVNQRRSFDVGLYPSKQHDQSFQKKTIKSDQKIVEQYRQKITICSIQAYHQNKQQTTPIVIGADAGNQNNTGSVIERPQTAKQISLSMGNSPAKFYHPLGNRRPQLATRDATYSQQRNVLTSGVPQLVPDEAISKTVAQTKIRLQTAQSFSKFQSVDIKQQANLQKALQVQPPSQPLKSHETVKETIEPSQSSLQCKPKPLPLTTIQLREKFKGTLTINNGRPLLIVQDSQQQNIQQQTKIAYYIDFDNLFKRLIQIIKNLLHIPKKTSQDDDTTKQLESGPMNNGQDETIVVEMLNMISKADQLVFLERENCLVEMVRTIRLIFDEQGVSKDQMMIAVKLTELFGRLSRKNDVQNLIMMHDSLLLELSSALFLNKGLNFHKESPEYKIAMQNLGLTLIHSSHLYALEQSVNGAKILLQSPKAQKINEESIDEMLMASVGLSSMSLATSQGHRKVYIPGNTRQTQLFNNRAFDCGLVAAFQQANLDDKNPLQEIIKLNLLSFFKKPLNIQRQIRILRAIQERQVINSELESRQTLTAQQSRARSNSRLRGGQDRQAAIISQREATNLSKGIGVLLKNNPLENNLIIKNLFDSGFLELQKLIDYNLSLLYEKSINNDLQMNSLQGFTRDQSLHSAVRRSFKQTPGSSTSKKLRTSRDTQIYRRHHHQHHQSQEIKVVDDQMSDEMLNERLQEEDEQEGFENINDKSIITQPRTEQPTKNNNKHKDLQALFFSPMNSSTLLGTQAKKQARISQERTNKNYQMEKMKNINEFFAANAESKTQDNFASFVSGQGTVEQSLANEIQTINSQYYCNECCSTSPLQRRANHYIRNENIQNKYCKKCGNQIEFDNSKPQIQQKDRLKELQQQYQRLLLSAELPNRDQTSNAANKRSQFTNNIGGKPASSYFEHPNRRNLLTGQHIMTNKGTSAGDRKVTQIDTSQNTIFEKKMATIPLSPTRQMMVTTVETVQQQFGPGATGASNLLIGKEYGAISQINTSQLQRSPNEQSRQSLINGGLSQHSLSQSPMKGGRGHTQGGKRKQQNTSRMGKTKTSNNGQHQNVNTAHLMNMMQNYGVQQFKISKGSLASQILAVSRPQTQQMPQRMRKDSEIRKKQRENDIKALYQQQLVVMAPNVPSQASASKLNAGGSVPKKY